MKNTNLAITCPECKGILVLNKVYTDTLIFENNTNVINCTKCNTKILLEIKIQKLKEKENEEVT